MLISGDRRLAYQAHPFGFASKFFPYIGFAALAKHFGANSQVDDFKTDGLIGPDLPPKLSLLDRREKEKSVFTQDTKLADSGTSGLRHGFDKDDPGDHGVAGKMPLKKELGVGEGPPAGQPFLGDIFQTVNKEERLPVRQKLLDRFHKNTIRGRRISCNVFPEKLNTFSLTFN